MPSYNHELFVAEAIASVAAQTYRPLELVVIDDGSTDSTWSIIERLAPRYPFMRFSRQENAGVSVTSNRLMALAKGEYFALLASDDAFTPTKLAAQVELMEKSPNIGAVFTHVLMVDKTGRIEKDSSAKVIFNHPRTQDDLRRDLAFHNVLCAPSCLMRRRVYESIGEFAPALVYTQDYEYWLRLVQRFDIAVIEQPLTRYRWHGGNLSAINEKRSADETWRTISTHLDAMLRLQPSLYASLGELAANLGKLSYSGGAYEDSIRFLEPSLDLYDLPLDNHFRLLGAYLNTMRFAEASRWTDVLSTKRNLTDEMRGTLNRTRLALSRHPAT